MARRQDLTKIQIELDQAEAKYNRTLAEYQEDPDDEKLAARYRMAKSDLAVKRRTWKVHREQIRAATAGEGDATARPESLAVSSKVREG